MDYLSRIQVDPAIMLGQPVVRGTRLPVYVLVEAIAGGDTPDDLLAAYPFLTREDVEAALRFAARLAEVGFEVAPCDS